MLSKYILKKPWNGLAAGDTIVIEHAIAEPLAARGFIDLEPPTEPEPTLPPKKPAGAARTPRPSSIK